MYIITAVQLLPTYASLLKKNVNSAHLSVLEGALGPVLAGRPYNLFAPPQVLQIYDPTFSTYSPFSVSIG